MRITRSCGGYPLMSTFAFSLRRNPIGGSDASVRLLATWRAGQTAACWVRGTVTRIAWPIEPRGDLVVAHEPGKDREAGRVG